MSERTITARRLTGIFGLARIIVGVVALVAPNWLAAFWVGRLRHREAGAVLLAAGSGTVTAGMLIALVERTEERQNRARG